VKTLLWILGVIALIVLLGGALNHETDVPLDYLVGSTSGASLFWVAVVVAAALVVAGLAGWAVGGAGSGDACGKLEQELETTYRRLRDCEARMPQPPSAPADEAVTAATAAPADETVTAVAPAPAGSTDAADAAEPPAPP